MFEIQINDHHYFSKSIFLGVLILVLGITTWTNVFAQKVVKISLPTDYTIAQTGSSSKDWNNDGSIIPLSGDNKEDFSTGIGSNSGSETKTESSYSGLATGVLVSSGIGNSGDVDSKISDTAMIYVRKIEALITIKGQETRMDMIGTMNKFLSKYPPEHPMYRTVSRIVEIITLGDVAYKLEYCTQFEGKYTLELFGMPLQIYSTIKYDNQLQKCQITYQYPDKSVHTCRLDEQQKLLLSRAMKQKQGLNKFVPDWAFESVVEGFLHQDICFESQKVVISTAETGSSLSGLVATGLLSKGTVTSRWTNRGRK